MCKAVFHRCYKYYCQQSALEHNDTVSGKRQRSNIKGLKNKQTQYNCVYKSRVRLCLRRKYIIRQYNIYIISILLIIIGITIVTWRYFIFRLISTVVRADSVYASCFCTPAQLEKNLYQKKHFICNSTIAKNKIITNNFQNYFYGLFGATEGITFCNFKISKSFLELR